MSEINTTAGYFTWVIFNPKYLGIFIRHVVVESYIMRNCMVCTLRPVLLR
jgi:hypothetical protein